MAHYKLNDSSPWTPEAVAELIHLVRVERLTNVEIAERTGRGIPGISTAISRFAIRADSDDMAQRTCMPCRKPFWSLHVGNRICGMCKHNLQLECA